MCFKNKSNLNPQQFVGNFFIRGDGAGNAARIRILRVWVLRSLLASFRVPCTHSAGCEIKFSFRVCHTHCVCVCAPISARAPATKQQNRSEKTNEKKSLKHRMNRLSFNSMLALQETKKKCLSQYFYAICKHILCAQTARKCVCAHQMPFPKR